MALQCFQKYFFRTNKRLCFPSLSLSLPICLPVCPSVRAPPPPPVYLWLEDCLFTVYLTFWNRCLSGLELANNWLSMLSCVSREPQGSSVSASPVAWLQMCTATPFVLEMSILEIKLRSSLFWQSYCLSLLLVVSRNCPSYNHLLWNSQNNEVYSCLEV